jgi:hypothetical protein
MSNDAPPHMQQNVYHFQAGEQDARWAGYYCMRGTTPVPVKYQQGIWFEICQDLTTNGFFAFRLVGTI